MILFLIAFFLTFLLIRTGTFIFDHPGSDKSDVNTPTKKISRYLGIEIHHWHIGGLIAIVAGILTIIFGFNNLNKISLAIGTSLFLDQAPFLFMTKEKCDIIYFTWKGFSIALIVHLVLAGILVFVL